MTLVAVPPPGTAPPRQVTVGLPVWQAPLVPLALAVTAGILVDRVWDVPPTFSLVAAAASLLLFAIHALGPQALLRLLYLWMGFAALGAAYHHARRYGGDTDDVRHLATEEGQPARLRGVIDSPPALTKGTDRDPLRSFARKDTTRFVLSVTAVFDPPSGAWRGASGLVRVSVAGNVGDLSAGDSVELVGRLALPEAPANPGEFDYAAYLSDRDIAATLTTRDTGSVMLLRRGGWSPTAWPAVVRGWGQSVLTDAIPAPQGDLAAALLLGDSPGMTTEDWDLYLRTGVIHVLAISGQHLVVLAGFLWIGLRLARVRRRRGALVVALILVFYALVAGGRPPVMRSAWMVLAYSGGVLLGRPTNAANTFALAWLLVALTNPADVGNAGCQLSFLAVAVLVWGVPGMSAMSYVLGLNLFASRDPLQQAIDESRPMLLQVLYGVCRTIGEAYLMNVLVWLAVTPLAAYHFHLVSPIALLLGPPLVLLTSIALLAGFAVLLLSSILGPLAWPFALAAQWSLAGCAGLTGIGSHMPGAYFYIPDVSAWWLWCFYGTLLVALALRVPVRFPRLAFAGLFTGLALGLTLVLWPHRPGEFRCTFLAVGHGGCAVIETPDRQVLLYDAGSIGGPDVTRRSIAPFLWQRGIRRIDELIVSHADLDHFNGIPELVQRFAIGRITHTPTFPQRDLDAVRVALGAIERRGIPMRVVSAGERWSAGQLTIEVLHPPPAGPEGKENVRSLVLLMRHRGVSILLTGDLEEAGLTQVLALPPRPVDVLMGPHHGSARANTTALARWANPQVVVLCQGRSDNTSAAAKAYAGGTVLGTWPHGAVTIRQDASGAWVETFRTRQRHVLER
jgi:competence protein ComEC